MEQNYREPQYQVVIFIDYDDGRLYPLTEGLPRALLPVANRKLLSFQLDMLAKSNAAEVIIVAPKEFNDQLTQFLSEEIREGMSVELVIVEEMKGTADGLRAVRERIRGEFICMCSDVISQFCLHDLVTMHQSKAATITMLLSAAPTEDMEKKGAGRKIKKLDEEDQEFIGLCDNGRVVIKKSAVEVKGKCFSITKPLLHRCTNLTVRTDLLDMGVYVMSHWVLDHLHANKKISSIRAELIPYFVNRQFQSAMYLMAEMPALRQGSASLEAVNPYLVSLASTQGRQGAPMDLVDCLSHELLNSPHVTSHLSTRASCESLASSQGNRSASSQGNRSMQAGGGAASAQDDIISCYAVVHDHCPEALSTVPGQEGGGVLLQRVTNLVNYMSLNREVPTHTHNPWTPWPRISYLKKEQTVLGDNCQQGENVTLKRSAIGHNCRIGARSKLNNCVVMDNVVIGDSCTVQYTIICSGVEIDNNCNLDECQVMSGMKIAAGTKLKGEVVD